VSQQPDASVIFLPAESAQSPPAGPFVVVVRTRDECLRWLDVPTCHPEWLQIEGLLDEADVWAAAAQGRSTIPLDVFVADPAKEFSSLYRLVDVRNARSVRVTLPARPGMMKALRLAASLQLPVRLLPGQPDAAALECLKEAADFYLHDTLVDAPIEPFHSVLAAMRGACDDNLWRITEHDPALFDRRALEGPAALPPHFVSSHFADLVAQGAECATCPWQHGCTGYFKWPDASYSCAGVKELFGLLEDAAAEIQRDLAGAEAETESVLAVA
jgi:hypothetical protein